MALFPRAGAGDRRPEEGDGALDGPVYFQAAGRGGRHRGSGNRRLACEGGRRGRRGPEPRRRDDGQGDGGDDLAGVRQGTVNSWRARADGGRGFAIGGAGGRRRRQCEGGGWRAARNQKSENGSTKTCGETGTEG